jgi:hypothetical protein
MSIALIIGGGIVIISVFGMVSDRIGNDGKDKREKEIEKIKCQKEILELEIEKERLTIKRLEGENKKLDTIIYEK